MDETAGLLSSKPEDITTPKKEAKWLVKSAVPVAITYSLQLSMTTVSLWTVGQLGKVELASMSLCIVLVAVCGYGIFQGSATSIDTLAAQAYGRGDYPMVGIITSRCALFMLCIGAFIGIIWSFPYTLLTLVGGDEQVLEYTASLLRTMRIDLPGYVIFECCKHYFQVQGLFHAGTIVLCICFPLNIALNYFLVLSPTTGMGLSGAPWAIILTDQCAIILSVLYGIFFTDRKCWPANPFTKVLLQDWKEMVKLAIPGAIMYEAEWLAFEVITLGSSRLGTTIMAAQSIIGNICSLAFQIPMSFGLAASTRVGNLIGSQSLESVKIGTRVSLIASGFTAVGNFSAMTLSRYQLGSWFSDEADVIQVVAETLPLAAVFQLSDSINCLTGGILRGQGKQALASALNLIFYYVFAIPLSFVLAFGYNWGLKGLWVGLVLGLSCVAILQFYFVVTTKWRKLIRDAALQASYSSNN